MIKWITKLALKFLSYDSLAEIIAKALAYILEYARKKTSPETWEKAKEVNTKVKAWTTLLDEVYEDDTLTPEEEKKIADAIANCTTTESIYELITGKNKDGKKIKKQAKIIKKSPKKQSTKVK